MKYTDENVKECFNIHSEVDMSRLAYIYACQDRATGIFGFIRMRYWLVGWDGKKFHLIETNLSGKELGFRSFSGSDIESVKIKNRLVNTRIELKIKGQDQLKLDATSKVMGLKHQKDHLETILKALDPSA